MSVYRRGKSWYINITLGGVRINRKAGNTKKQAQEISETLKTKHRLKLFHLSELAQEDLPFSYLANEYLKYADSVNSKRSNIVEQNFYQNHVKPYFENFMVYDITSPVLVDYQAHLKNKGLSNRTTNILVGIVRKIINHAVRKGLISKPDITYPQLKESRRVHAFFTEQEFEQIINNLEDDLTRARILVIRHTGMRPAEAAYLEWNDINLSNQTIRIQSKPEWTVKDKEDRIVPMNTVVYRILKELSDNKKSRWVFSESENPVLNIRRALQKAAIKAGITRPVGMNMLRHTFAVLQLQKGANIEAIRMILGHSDISTTMRYIDCVNEEKIRAVS